MKNFVIYTPSGQITRTGVCQEETIYLQASSGELLLEGVMSSQSMYVENGVLIDMPEPPGEHFAFDYESKTWKPDVNAAIGQALTRRNELLSKGPDRVNPMWWSSMTATEQSEVSAYRQSLLDITNQSGYPMNIEWPEIPSVFKG